MEDRGFDCRYDVRSSTLEISGRLVAGDWGSLADELDRAFRRTACQLTVDLTRVTGWAAHDVGRLVQLCNRCFPGTLVVPPVRRPVAAVAPTVTTAA